MEIIEYYICGKENNESTCEDGFVINGNLVAIIDGVTSKGSKLYLGQKSGLRAKNVLCKGLKEDGIDLLDAQELFERLNSFLYEYMQSMDDLELEDYLRASVIVYNDRYKEIWSYGDCQCMINDIVYTHTKLIDEIHAEQRSKVIQDALDKGISLDCIKKDDIGRKAIMPNLMNQFRYENVDEKYGYPVLNGQGINHKLLKKYSVKTSDTIVLASDGYPTLCDTLYDSEQALKYIIENDPMCFRLYKSTKGIKEGNVSFDDRTYCKLNV